MASYGFGFRASTRKGGSAGRLYLRVVHGCASRSVTTNYRIFPHEWDSARRRLVIPYGRGERTKVLTEYEGAMKGDLRRMEMVVGALEREGDHTVDQIMLRYRAVMVGNTFDAYSNKLATELEREGNFRTAKAYRTATARLKNFNGGRDVEPDNLTAGLINDFQQALKVEGRSMNTISFYMRTLRAIYNKAIAEGRIFRRNENPFAGVYTGVSPTRKLALSPVELARLSAFDPTMPPGSNRLGAKAAKSLPAELPENLRPALGMFLFCYHARGMCFVDMANLRKTDLVGDTIRYRRRKTGQTIELRVLPAMRRIIDWFAPMTVHSRYLFPVIVDPAKDPVLQYESGLRLQNQHLKKIAKTCGIDRRFSTHSARHSWATVAKNAGLPLVVISEGLGHSNQRTTEIYMASLERSIVDHASRLVSEAIGQGWPGEEKRRETFFSRTL